MALALVLAACGDKAEETPKEQATEKTDTVTIENNELTFEYD